ncbi:neuronal acetylcholine receptor subunit alpha-9-like isoform X2 [Tachypleus tridentatus]|uniref:neuronal acetylcholine receptor subunit alpha-9-like isoform X2 n=1 Tax=Tachypleus tridentatus TaxID=6853 RepID=UPI003FD4C1BD
MYHILVSFLSPSPYFGQMDERRHILTTSCWITQKWTDYYLRWNVSDFNGIPVVRIPASQVWRPDISLYNNAGFYQHADGDTTNVIVRHTGDVTWRARAVLRSSCPMDMKYFPFDVQTCSLKFASRSYDGLQIELIKEAGQSELNEYQENGDFELSDFSATSTVFQYSCCEEFYLEISYRLELRRRPLYYVFNLILPCLLMNSLALVTFCMPCESGEKVTFSTCIFLTLILFFVLVRDILPPSHKTPLISLHYVITICLVASTTVFTVFSLNVHHQGRFDKEVPQCLRNVMLGSLAKFTCCKCSSDSESNHENQSDDEKSNVEHLSVNEDNKLWFGRIEQYKFSPRLRQRKETKEMSGNIDFFEDEHNKQHLKILSKIHESVKRNDMRMCEKKRRENNKSEWHQVSLVCDRLWLVLFLIASAVGTLLILLSSPYVP